MLLKDGVTLQRETFAKIREELPALFEEHYQEIAHDKGIPLEPDWEQYSKVDFAGLMRVFTARAKSGELIGYAFFMVHRNLHYKSLIDAVQDLLFISKKHRGFGEKFIGWCDVQLREEGVNRVSQHVKLAHNFGPLLEKLGYKAVDVIYVRRF